MRDTAEPVGLPRAEPSTWFVWALAAAFVGLGALFLLAPGWGAALFGVPAPEGAGFLYLPAIGLRDLAFGLYLFVLSLTATRRALALVFAATVVIPAGDMVIVASVRGLESPGHLLLHGLSAAAMAAMALWLLATASHRNRGGHPT